MSTYLIFAGRNAGLELRNQRASTPTHFGAKIDHTVVFQALKELLSPRFDGTVSCVCVLQYVVYKCLNNTDSIFLKKCLHVEILLPFTYLHVFL